MRARLERGRIGRTASPGPRDPARLPHARFTELLDLGRWNPAVAPVARGRQSRFAAMLLLAFHIVSIALLASAVGYVAYRTGYHKAERRVKRRLEAQGIQLPPEA
jgi:hypothetical protein